MKIKTSELTGAALDWAVARCEEGEELASGWHPHKSPLNGTLTYVADQYRPSTHWTQGGPIIEREKLFLQPGPVWYAMSGLVNQPMTTRKNGPTPLIAAMRCYVASKMGDEVDVPDELVA